MARRDDFLQLLHQAGAYSNLRLRTAALLARATGSEQLAEELTQALEGAALLSGRQEDPFVARYPEPEDVAEGEILLGHLPYGGEVRLPLRALVMHGLVTGPTGVGKTMTFAMLLEQVIRHGASVWIFDSQSEYARLLGPLFGRDELELIHWRDFRRNPFEPPEGIDQPSWIDLMCDYMREAFYYRDRITELHRRVCDEALKITRASRREILSPVEYLDQLHKLPKGIQIQDRFDSLMRFARALRRKTYWCRRGFDLAELSRRSVVFDLNGMPDDFRLPFVADLVVWQRASRDPLPHNRLDLLMVFDEVSHFVTEDARKRSDLGEGFFIRAVKSVRKLGIGVVLSDQTYANLIRDARTNCRTKIILETSDGLSRRCVQSDLGLTRDEEEYLARLGYELREAVVSLPTCPEPFRIEIPEAQPGRELTPGELETRRREMLAAWRWEPVQGAKPEPDGQDGQESLFSRVPSGEAFNYLASIPANYFLPVSVMDRRLKISGSQGNRLREHLLELGLIEEHEINTGTRGGNVKIILPNTAGYHLLDRRRYQYRMPGGDGSVIHKFWQHQIAYVLENALLTKAGRGWKAHVEYTLPGGSKRVDVGALRGSRKLAYEVYCTDLSKEVANYEKDLADGWDRVVYCCENEEALETLRAAVNATLADYDTGPQYVLLREFWPGIGKMR